jgi:protein phosphatase
VEFGARARRGRLRSIAEDHYLILRMGRYQETLLTSLPERDLPRRFDECGYGMVVADGMGVAGEAASRLAISTLVYLATTFGKWHIRVNEPIAEEMLDRAKRFFRGVDSSLLQASQGPRRLQTTMTAVYTAGADLFFAHVGHSRAYVYRDNELMQLTHDHTLDREQRWPQTPVDRPSRPRDLQHILTETLGGGAAAAPRIDVERCSLLDGDLVLLCTNGLTDVANDGRIATALRLHDTPDDQCQALIDLAVSAGTHDDVTVLAAKYRIRQI